MLAGAPEDGDAVLAADHLPIIHAGAPYKGKRASDQLTTGADQFRLMSQSREHAMRPRPIVSFWTRVASSVLPTGKLRKKHTQQSGM